MLIPILLDIFDTHFIKSNFIGRSREYKNHLKGRLPKDLVQHAHSMRWPISLDTPNIHLASYFGEPSYNFPRSCFPRSWLILERMITGNKAERHYGLDLQTAAGTPAVSPINGRVIYQNQDRERKTLFDVGIYSSELEILCYLGHLDTRGINLPETSPEFNWKNQQPENLQEVYAGQTVGRVAEWPFTLSTALEIPEDVEKVYGRRFNHLHLEFQHFPDELPGETYLYSSSESRSFNPLLILARLNL